MIYSHSLSSHLLAILSAGGFLLTTPLLNFWPGALLGYWAWGALCLYGNNRAAGLGSLFIGGAIGSVVFYGVSDLSPLTYTALVIALSAYFGFIGYCSACFMKARNFLGVINAAIAFVVAEFVLGSAGFPFSLGAAWVNSPFSTLVSPYLGNEWQNALYWLMTLLLLTLPWLWKTLLLSGCCLLWLNVDFKANDSQDVLKVALLQTNLASDVINFPGVPGNLEKWLEQLDQLQGLLSDTDDVDLVVFPESVLPGFNGDFLSLTDTILSRVKSPYVLSHQYLLNEKGSVVSSNVFLDQRANLQVSNGKTYPVPVFESYLEPGEYQSSLSLADVMLATFVCSESFFVNLVRERAKSVDILVVTVNDRLLTGSMLPEYHLRMEQIRAAELGLPLLRVANSGPTAIINGQGEVQQKLDELQLGIVNDVVTVTKRSFFSEYYVQVFQVSLLVMLFSGLGCFYRARRKTVRKQMINIPATIERHGVSLLAVFSFSGLFYISLNSQNYQQTGEILDNSPRSVVSAYDFFVRQTGIAKVATGQVIKDQFAVSDSYLRDVKGSLKKWSFVVVETIYGKYLLLDYDKGVFLVYKDSRVVKLTEQKLADIAIGQAKWFRLKY